MNSYLERKTKPAKFLIFTIIFSVMKLVKIIIIRPDIYFVWNITRPFNWQWLIIFDDFEYVYIQSYIQVYIQKRLIVWAIFDKSSIIDDQWQF